MGCKDLFPNGFVCSCDGYEPTDKELVNAMQTVSKENIDNYKEDFKNYVISYCKNYSEGLATEEDIEDFKQIAEDEVEAHIENVGVSELDFENPENDAEECISYWSY